MPINKVPALVIRSSCLISIVTVLQRNQFCTADLCLVIHSVFFSLPSDITMSQVEKKAGLLRRTSSSKKPLKEKVVLMYDEIFAVSVATEASMIESRGGKNYVNKSMSFSSLLPLYRKKTQRKTTLASGMSCFL